MKRNLFVIDFEELATFEDFIFDSANSSSMQVLEKAINTFLGIPNTEINNDELVILGAEKAQSLASSLDDSNISFILLRGDTSSGKSHLLEAIAKKLYEHNPSLKIALGQARELIPIFADSKNQGKKIHNLENLDVLLLDDLHLFADSSLLLDKEVESLDENLESNLVQQELALYLDSMQKKKTLIVFTYSSGNDFADFALKKKSARLEEVLFSRLFYGVTLNLVPAGLNVHSLYAQKISEKNKLPLTKSMCLTLARFARDMRQLQGLLKTISSYAKVNKGQFGEEEFRQFLRNFEGKKEITPEMIIVHTAQYFQVQVKDIKGKSRLSKYVLARQISMFLCRRLLGFSFPKIAKVYGGKDHTTIVYACSKIENEAHLLAIAKELSQKILQEASISQIRI